MQRKIRTRHGLLCVVAAAIALLACLISAWWVQSTHERHATHAEIIRRQQELIRGITSVAGMAAQGLAPDFRSLSDYRVEFLENLELLEAGDPEFGFAPLAPHLDDALRTQSEAFAPVSQELARILDGRRAFDEMASVRRHLRESDSLTAVDGGGTNLQWQIERLKALLERFSRSAHAGEALAAEIRALTQSIEQHPVGPYGAGVVTAANRIIHLTPAVLAARDAASTIPGLAGNALSASFALEQGLYERHSQVWNRPALIYLFGSIAISLMFLSLLVILRDARRRQSDAEDAKSRQHATIIELLDQISVLADGDLTVDVTVNEDFTGAIADAINYTVATLRKLVGTISNTSVEVATAAKQTRHTAISMNHASNQQAEKMGALSARMTIVSQSMQQVCNDATQLAETATDSIAVAREGADTAGRAIGGMDTLRLRIEETATRIHRLTERSAEVGNIIEYVHDIADQTRTLALNASIQAANAGAQGRGFAVVADEVQRLAEHSAEATRQVEQLLRGIQADTDAARVSMERSTQIVAEGAAAAEEAGQALGRMESSTTQLADFIGRIAGSAEHQSRATTTLARHMRAMKVVAERTSGSAERTAGDIDTLNHLSLQLRKSISGFRLPEGAGTLQ